MRDEDGVAGVVSVVEAGQRRARVLSATGAFSAV
jgi:hypothetical protein